MPKLRSKVNRLIYNNRNKGIRNLMLYIGIGNVVIFLLTMLNPSNPLFYNLLCFDFSKISSGQVWRLVSFPLVYLCTASRPLLGLLSLFFYYWCGMVLEQYWGTLRLNLYYLCSMLLTDLAAILICLVAMAEFGVPGSSLMGLPLVTGRYINASLLLAVATVLPNEMIRIYFIIPVKMKWLAWLDVGLTLYGILDSFLSLLRLGFPYITLYLLLLLPLVPIGNYLLFFGKQAAEILPDFLRFRPTRKSWKRAVKQGTIYPAGSTGSVKNAGSAGRRDGARFRCTVCGRTELTNPKLEFRYCSKCAGYRCYCEDHIQNHVHIQDI